LVEIGDATGTVGSKHYWNLIEDIHIYLNVINTPLIEVSFIHEAQVVALKMSIMIALAALVQLYALFAPFQPESARKREEIVDEIAAMTGMFAAKDFRYLDKALGVCFGYPF
jgi:hypothetical protein